MPVICFFSFCFLSLSLIVFTLIWFVCCYLKSLFIGIFFSSLSERKPSSITGRTRKKNPCEIFTSIKIKDLKKHISISVSMRKGNHYDDLFPDMNALLGTVVILSSVLVGSNASKSHGDGNSTASFCSLDRDGWMMNERDTFKRDDPDAILNGFFPFWGALVLALSCKDLSLFIYSLSHIRRCF